MSIESQNSFFMVSQDTLSILQLNFAYAEFALIDSPIEIIV